MTVLVRVRNHVRKQWLLFTVISVFAGLVFFPDLTGHRLSKESLARSTMMALLNSSAAYFQDYGNYPTNDSAEVFKILSGNNSRKIVYIQVTDRDLNQQVNLVDPWGTPYRMLKNGTNGMVFRSAGPNRVFEENVKGSDDLVSRE